MVAKVIASTGKSLQERFLVALSSWITPFGKARRGLGRTGGDYSGYSGILPYHNRNLYAECSIPDIRIDH